MTSLDFFQITPFTGGKMWSSYIQQHLSDCIDRDPCTPDFLTKLFTYWFRV